MGWLAGLCLLLAGVGTLDDGGPDALFILFLPFVEVTSLLTSLLLEWTGLSVDRSGGVIALPGLFVYEIDYRCVGIWPVALHIVLVLADRRHRTKRVDLIVVGGMALVFLNFVRLTTLFWIGVISPEFFELAHDVAWPAIVIAAIFFLSRCLPGLMRLARDPARR